MHGDESWQQRTRVQRYIKIKAQTCKAIKKWAPCSARGPCWRCPWQTKRAPAHQGSWEQACRCSSPSPTPSTWPHPQTRPLPFAVAASSSPSSYHHSSSSSLLLSLESPYQMMNKVGGGKGGDGANGSTRPAVGFRFVWWMMGRAVMGIKRFIALKKPSNFPMVAPSSRARAW